MLHSTELASFFNGLGDVERSAKPLCVGSIPTRASIPFNILEAIRDLLKEWTVGTFVGTLCTSPRFPLIPTPLLRHGGVRHLEG